MLKFAKLSKMGACNLTNQVLALPMFVTSIDVSYQEFSFHKIENPGHAENYLHNRTKVNPDLHDYNGTIRMNFGRATIR